MCIIIFYLVADKAHMVFGRTLVARARKSEDTWFAPANSASIIQQY